MDPPGSELSLDQLVTALKWKIQQKHGLSTEEAGTLNSLEPILPYEHKVWLEATILSAKQRQNAKAPVNTLPPEILSRIFRFTKPRLPWVPDALRIDYRSALQLQTFRWVAAVTNVCAHWRYVASADVWLWNSMFLPRSDRGGEEAGTQFLRVAGSTTPLHIHEPLTKQPFCFSLREEPRKRLESLHLCPDLPAAYHHNASDLLKDFRAPSLQSLALAVPSGQLSSMLPESQDSLKYLALNYTRDWTGNTFRNLTHLALFDGYIMRHHSWTVTAFVNLLSLSQRLEHLILWDSSPEPADDFQLLEISRPDFKPTVFPHLRLIVLAFVPQLPRVFLSMISTPSDCMVHIRQKVKVPTYQAFTLIEGAYTALFDVSPPYQPPPLRPSTAAPPTVPTTAVVQFDQDKRVAPRHSTTHSVTFCKEILYLKVTGKSFLRAIDQMDEILSSVAEVILRSWKGMDQMKIVSEIVSAFPNIKKLVFTTEVDYVEILQLLERLHKERLNLHIERLVFVPVSHENMQWLPEDEREKVRVMESSSPLVRQWGGNEADASGGKVFTVVIGQGTAMPNDPIHDHEANFPSWSA